MQATAYYLLLDITTGSGIRSFTAMDHSATSSPYVALTFAKNT
jgi:hypothetical protein